MVDLVDAILKGIDLHSFFYSNYYGPIKYRPLTTFELNLVVDQAVANKPFEVKQFLRDYQILHIKPSIPREMISTLAKSYKEMCVLVVYHAVKDFQKDEWQQEYDSIPLGILLLNDPKCYLEIEKMAEEVLAFTTIPREQMKVFIETDSGKKLASAVLKMEYPLADAMWKLTDIQVTFMVESSKQVKRYSAIKELQKDLSPSRITPPEHVDLLKKCEEIRKAIVH